MSEQPSVMSEKPQLNAPNAMMRRHYRMDSQPSARKLQPQPASLLMGYAHLNATFTVDGSLMDQSPFEEVKQKGFLGGQAGGGVVGVTQKKARPTSGFLGGFNFNSLGESLNSLVGGETMSSVREMNAVTNAKAIPLLSTPQSLLFVNLTLEPGEEKSYTFACPVPRGLPSSYRGKAIKITYNLLIGVQTAPTGPRDRDHKVRQVSVPIRVFAGVDSDGEVLGHDLMQPHVLLRDPARTASIDGPPTSDTTPPASTITQRAKLGDSEAFLTYIDSLLDRTRRRHSSAGSMLDSAAPQTKMSLRHPTLAAIERAILVSNRPTSTTNQGPPTNTPNKFNITRAGAPVAQITLSRTLFRLGETVTTSIVLAALTQPPQPSSSSSSAPPAALTITSLHATLETTERVTSSLAVRSAASIARVSRRVHAQWSSGPSGAVSARRLVFCPTIPAAATPTFVTTGVELCWGVRLEFVVARASSAPAPAPHLGEGEGQDLGATAAAAAAADEEDEEEEGGAEFQQTRGVSEKTAAVPIFEDLMHDERGTVSVAVERVECDSFEVVIPIVVYGDLVPESSPADREIEGGDVKGIPI
jgi:RAB6A-GEF complex partner protein 2